MFFRAFLLLLLFFVGCARVPKHELASLSKSVTLEQSIDTALAREFFEEGGWPTEQWWEMFGDSQLNSLIELALKENPTLQRALAKVTEVEQEAKKQRASLFPSLSANYTENWEYFSKNGFIRSFYPAPPGVVVPATTNQLDLGLNFNYEIDFFGRNRHLFDSAWGMAQAQKAERAQAILMITTLIAQTYIELQMKLFQQETLEERLDARKALLELSLARNSGGIESVSPLLDRESGVYALEQLLLQMDKEIALDRHMLNLLVGKGPDEDLVKEPLGVLFNHPLALPEHLSCDLLARRPDLTAQLWRTEAAAKQIGAAKADFYPRVNLMAFGQLEALAFSKFLNFSNKQGGLDPAIHLPIFTGGRLRANLKSKVAKFNEETYLYNELILNAAKEVADQVVILTATFDTAAYQAASLEIAEEQLSLQSSRYTQGLYNLSSVLEKQEIALHQQFLLYGYERDYLLSIIKMVKALGGGYLSEGPS